MGKAQGLCITGAGRILSLPVSCIRPNPAQPRSQFDPQALQELADSIAVYGVLQPLSVRRTGPGDWELIAGERRLRAARMAGLTEVPCIPVAVDAEDSGILALVENLQRRDLDYLEQARGLARLMREFHLSQEQAARRLGKSQSAIANKLRLLRLPPSVLERLESSPLTERHARALLRLSDEQSQLRVLNLAITGDWTVARTERYIDQLPQQQAPKPVKRELSGFRLRDARLLINSVRHHLDMACAAGVEACTEQVENEAEIVFTIRIPKKF